MDVAPVKSKWSNASPEKSAPVCGPPVTTLTSSSSNRVGKICCSASDVAGREFRRFDHASITGREYARQRAKRQVDREVPRTDDTDDTQRLKLDPGPRAEQIQRERPRLALLGSHPLRNVFDRVLERPHGCRNIREQALVAAAVSEVRVQRVDQRVPVFGNQFDGALQPILADGGGHYPFA